MKPKPRRWLIMALPVFLVMSLVRSSLEMRSRDVAEQLGITHGFLSQCEDFERVPDICNEKNYYLEKNIKNFFKENLPQLDPKIHNITSEVIPNIYQSLIRDRIFHSFIPYLIPAMIEGTRYGPLFWTILLFFREVSNSKGIYIKKTANAEINTLINHAFERTWGKYAFRRKAKSFNTIQFTSIEENDNYMGYFDNNDARKIFWPISFAKPFYKKLVPTSLEQQQNLPYLFFYTLLKKYSINFANKNENNLPKAREYLILPYYNFYNKADEPIYYCNFDCNSCECDYFVIHGPSPIKELYIVFHSFLDGSNYNFCIRERR